jgi:hypothetical protein
MLELVAFGQSDSRHDIVEVWMIAHALRPALEAAEGAVTLKPRGCTLRRSDTFDRPYTLMPNCEPSRLGWFAKLIKYDATVFG